MYSERRYLTTLKLILGKALKELDSKNSFCVQNSLNNGLYIKIHSNEWNETRLNELKAKMQEIIDANHKIEIMELDDCDTRRKQCFPDREDVQLLLSSSRNPSKVVCYNLDGYIDYFHNKIYHNTGDVKLFDLEYYEKGRGLILKYPYGIAPDKLPPKVNNPKLADVFEEATNWLEILGVPSVGRLNKLSQSLDINNMIRVNEALHDKKLTEIAAKISAAKEVGLVTVAGPSSSGKTTFTKRLAIHLQVNGLNPVVISADNYYIGRKNVPLDEDGKPDFETIEALDLELINKNLVELLEGKETILPIYNFTTGKREKEGLKTKLPQNGIILVEGIHGLNERLTAATPHNQKFKIYISCLTALNLDDHNRVPTNQVRKLRRIVRDALSRDTGAAGTLSMWDSVRKGEEKYIFPYQEQADAIFNSSLVYELSVLKKHAIVVLSEIVEGDEHYEVAQEIIGFLNYIEDVDDELVPDDSLLREFIGGSYFYKY